MSSRTPGNVGWVLRGLLAAFLVLGSALPKLYAYPGDQEQYKQLGWPVERVQWLGALEIVLAVLYLVPRTSFLSVVLLTGYLGGAISAHARIGDSFAIPAAIGILVWVGYGLRNSMVFRLLLGKET